MKTAEDFIYIPIPTKERQPNYATIHMVFLDGRIPMMAQYNPQGWCYLSGIPATKAPEVIGGKGVSHWLEPISMEEYAKLCCEEKDLRIESMHQINQMNGKTIAELEASLRSYKDIVSNYPKSKKGIAGRNTATESGYSWIVAVYRTSLGKISFVK